MVGLSSSGRDEDVTETVEVLKLSIIRIKEDIDRAIMAFSSGLAPAPRTITAYVILGSIDIRCEPAFENPDDEIQLLMNGSYFYAVLADYMKVTKDKNLWRFLLKALDTTLWYDECWRIPYIIRATAYMDRALARKKLVSLLESYRNSPKTFMDAMEDLLLAAASIGADDLISEILEFGKAVDLGKCVCALSEASKYITQINDAYSLFLGRMALELLFKEYDRIEDRDFVWETVIKNVCYSAAYDICIRHIDFDKLFKEKLSWPMICCLAHALSKSRRVELLYALEEKIGEIGCSCCRAHAGVCVVEAYTKLGLFDKAFRTAGRIPDSEPLPKAYAYACIFDNIFDDDRDRALSVLREYIVGTLEKGIGLLDFLGFGWCLWEILSIVARHAKELPDEYFWEMGKTLRKIHDYWYYVMLMIYYIGRNEKIELLKLIRDRFLDLESTKSEKSSCIRLINDLYKALYHSLFSR